jgi:hypothetical protein
MQRVIFRTAVVSTGVLLSFGGVVFATSGGAGAARPSASYHGAAPAAGDQPEATAPSGDMAVDELRGSMESLTRARTSADAVESRIGGSPILRDNVVALDTARRVRAGTWIAASSSGDAVCLVASGELSCPPASEIAARGVWQRSGMPTRRCA